MSARPRRSATPTPATNRHAALKANLEERKRTLQAEIRMRLTVVRESHADADHKAPCHRHCRIRTPRGHLSAAAPPAPARRQPLAAGAAASGQIGRAHV